jgi:hypothetical protein
MRKALAVAIAMVAVAACGGPDIDAADKKLADDFWDGRSEIETEALCEELSTAKGRLRAAKEIGEELPNPKLDNFDESSDLADFAAGANQIGINDERGEKIAVYLHESKC